MRGALVIAVFCLLACTGVAASAPPVPTSLTECDQQVRDDPVKLDGYRCYWFVGRNQGLLAEAAQRLESMLESDPDNPRIQLYLGIILGDLGQSRAEGLCREAVEGFVAEDDARGEIYSRITLSMILNHQGRRAPARHELERALERAVAAGDRELESQVRIQLAWQWYYAREYGSAWEQLKQVEAAIFPEGEHRLRVDALGALAAVSWALGRYGDALEYYRRQVELLGGGDPFRASGIRRNMALVATSLAATGRISHDELIRFKREALDAAIRGGNKFAEPGARLMLAAELDGEDGLEEARRGLAVAREIEKLNDICWALWLIAEKLHKLYPEEPERAFAAVDESIALAQRWGDLEELARGLFVRARILANTDSREETIEATFEALDAVERIRDLQQEGEVRARVFGRFADDYRRSANGFLGDPARAPAVDDIERAFLVMERMRARSLLETLDAAGATVALLPTTPLAEERANVLEEVATIRRRLGSRELPGSEREKLLTELAGLEQREESLRDAIARQDPAFASVRGDISISLRDVREALRPDQAMLAFQVQESIKDADQPFYSGAWVTAITRAGVGAYPIPNGTEARSRIRLFLALLERRDGSGAQGAAQLYDDLLARALDGLPEGITSLVLVPDGPLHRLPFAALVDADTSSPLAERFEIVVVPSAAAWLRLRDGPKGATRSTLLALADPLRTGGENGGEDLGPLPHARREAAALRRNLGGEARVLVGSEATETAFKNAESADYALIHLAAHAVVNDEYPERSAVLLATSDDNDDDGLLDFGEIVTLKLDGQLVLLSACRSASGPLIGGEGVMGLASAFFQAGARVVVAGLWRVRDRETASLIDRFAKHLARGSSVAAALADAKRDLIRRGAPPADWAGLVVLGDGDLVPLEPRRGVSRPRVFGALTAALVLLVAVFAVLYRRRMLLKRAG